VKPGDDQEEVRLIAALKQASASEFFTIGQEYVTEVDSVEGRIERAAEAFQPEDRPLWDGQPRLIWDPQPLKAN
jgi:hypothetical protein